MGLYELLTVPVCLSMGDYSYVEYIEQQECENEEEIQNFFINLGKTTAVLYLFRSKDYHGENILASGRHPYLIDNETILHSSEFKNSDSGFENILQYINESVYSTGVLPYTINSNNSKKALEVGALNSGEDRVSPFISPFLVIIVTAYLYTQNMIDLGLLFSVYSFESMLFGRVNSVFNTVLGYINSKTFITRANEILVEEEEKQQGRKLEVKGDIRLDEVAFSYTKDSDVVINDLTMEIPRGKRIAIVGSSGSGKSTLSKLLMGLYSPTSGKIYYDGIDETELDKKFLRKQIGIVPQDMTLFNKTIFENIVGDGQYYEDEVINACKISNLHNEIKEMPMGYNTLVSEMGMNLSGGQRQRIILARAIVKNPRIIILDEATSYLDNINEKHIMNNFRREGITTIVIAHRLSTIIDSDQIFVLDSGVIKESGTHDELMKQAGLYYSMYELEGNR